MASDFLSVNLKMAADQTIDAVSECASVESGKRSYLTSLTGSINRAIAYLEAAKKQAEALSKDEAAA